MASQSLLSIKFVTFALLNVACFASQSSVTMPFELFAGDIRSKIHDMSIGGFNPYRKFNEWVNDIFFQYSGLNTFSRSLYERFGEERGYYLSSYMRDLILGSIVYWVTAGLWHIVIYRILGDRLFSSKKRDFPSSEVIIDQMLLAQSSLVMYAALPVASEFLIESKLTLTYFYVEEVGGWMWYGIYLFIYVVLVEVGIYWVHRTLHENKFLYKYVHGPHHKYNKMQTLTPWCSLAFNPLDGILQVRYHPISNY
jgi:Delta7-sterol 5-desaturase